MRKYGLLDIYSDITIGGTTKNRKEEEKMALITCPECGKEVSDKAATCPNCGYPIQQIVEAKETDGQSAEQNAECQSQENPDDNVEKEPAEEIRTDDKPVSQAAKTKSKKTLRIIVAAAVIVVIAVTAIVCVNAKKKADAEKAAELAAEQAAEEAKREAEEAKKARDEYIDNIQVAKIDMLSGASDAEYVCGLVHDVWYNTIFEESDSRTDKYTKNGRAFRDDFNESIKLLYLDGDVSSKVNDIEANQETVADEIKALQNPTEEFKTCYDTLMDLYDVYTNITNLAISPSGSIATYTSNFNDYDSGFLTIYNRLDTQIPEK